ncbi:MAG: DNA polymerase IV [Erysipelotrichaceae bacterium]|nr:DNA polymerase IV [Erysipelotrichaceae bacterium]
MKEGKYKTGDTVYIVSSGKVMEAGVLRYAGGFYTIRFSQGGGTKLRGNRLFASKEEALHQLNRPFKEPQINKKESIKKEDVSKPLVQTKREAVSDTQLKQIVIHVDMDAFYASVEARDDPSLKGKPLIIGALPNERRVVATCSYEARRYGVHSAMNIKEAYRLCPHGVFMHGNHEKYRRVSNQLHMIWNAYCSASEYLSLDEAYLDVTDTAITFEKACEFAKIIKKRTWEELGLTCSVGIAYCKAAAKMASEEKKPNGYFAIPTPKDFVDLVIDRDVRVLYTVGAKTAEKLHEAGIYTVRDIQNNEEKVQKLLGKQGRWLCAMAQGHDDSRVTPYKPEDAKSISREVTFQENVNDFVFLKDALVLLAISVERRAERYGLYGKGVTLKITYADMKGITRSKVIETSRSAVKIYKAAASLLEKVPHEKLRLIGVGIHNLTNIEGSYQLTLEEVNEEKESDLNSLLKEMEERYGLNFTGSLDKVFQGETLYKTLEYMRKHRKK